MKEIVAHFTIIEAFAAFFGVIQVILSRANNVYNYAFGIANILLAMYMYYSSQLYADIILNLYYLGMSVYGWYYWKRGKNARQTAISFSQKKDYIKAASISVTCFLVLAFWLHNYTDSDVVIWDSLISAFAWAGMWLMARRKIENWLFLNMSNLIAIPLLLYKELYIYSGLTIFLFIMGISGYINWRKLVRE